MMLLRISNTKGDARIYTINRHEEFDDLVSQFREEFDDNVITVSSINPHGMTPEEVNKFLFPTRQGRNQPRGKQQ